MRPRVLYLTSEYSLKSGWGSCSVNWIEGLRSEVASAVILTYSEADNSSAPWPIYPILRSQEFGRLKALLSVWDSCLARIITGQNFDIVHTLVEPLIMLGDVLAKKMNAKHIVQCIGTYSVSPLKTSWGTRHSQAIKDADQLIAISKYTAGRLKEEIPDLKISVALLGVDKIFFSPPKEVVKEKYFLFVGQPKPRKGFKTAIEAFRVFYKSNPQYRFLVAGKVPETPYLKNIKNYISKHKLPVKFLGEVSHERLVELFQSCTAHVLPSVSMPYNFEGFGLVHLEANRCGALSIGTRGTANEEVIKDQESGYLVDQSDSENLTKAMLCAERQVRLDPEGVVLRCVKHASRFSWNTSVQLIKKNYNKK